MRVLRFIINNMQPYRFYIWGIFFATVVICIGQPLKPCLVKKLIDVVAREGGDNLWIICGLYGVLQLIIVGAWRFSDFCLVRYVASFRRDIANYFMENLYAYSYSFFQNNLSGGLVSKVNDAFQIIPDLIFKLMNQFGYFIFMAIVSLWLLYTVNYIFVIIMLVWLVLFCSLTVCAIRKMMSLTNKYAEEKSKILGLVADYLSNMLSVKTFVTKKFELRNFNKFAASFLQASDHMGHYLAAFYTIQGVFTTLYEVSVIMFLIYVL